MTCHESTNQERGKWSSSSNWNSQGKAYNQHGTCLFVAEVKKDNNCLEKSLNLAISCIYLMKNWGLTKHELQMFKESKQMSGKTEDFKVLRTLTLKLSFRPLSTNRTLEWMEIRASGQTKSNLRIARNQMRQKSKSRTQAPPRWCVASSRCSLSNLFQSTSQVSVLLFAPPIPTNKFNTLLRPDN